jgi:hypothetical protein
MPSSTPSALAPSIHQVSAQQTLNNSGDGILIH